ncbi:hypothetical protein BYT27DRAFT_7105558 [Phlegmacium glaucopus]|nr:hypothetical protein BYT27DRAFT_7105558 [Phlegmacium glaucopus]
MAASISLKSGITDENGDRLGRSQRPATSKDIPKQLVWLDLAHNYLTQEIDNKKWEECVRIWFEFEKKELSELDTSSFRMPAKTRPGLLTKWLSSRKYRSFPVIPDKDVFATEWLSWWNAMQPQWRKNSVSDGFPLGLEVAKGKENIQALHKGGPSGLVTILIGLKWWTGDDKRWDMAVDDLTLCLKSFDRLSLKRKHPDGNESEVVKQRRRGEN